METLILKVLTNPSLERFRARIPSPVYSGLVAFVFSIPVAVLAGVTVKSPARAAQNPLDVVFAIPPVCFLAITLLFGALRFVGWLSGYRPFVQEWSNIAPTDAQSLMLRCQATAEAL